MLLWNYPRGDEDIPNRVTERWNHATRLMYSYFFYECDSVNNATRSCEILMPFSWFEGFSGEFNQFSVLNTSSYGVNPINSTTFLHQECLPSTGASKASQAGIKLHLTAELFRIIAWLSGNVSNDLCLQLKRPNLHFSHKIIQIFFSMECGNSRIGIHLEFLP